MISHLQRATVGLCPCVHTQPPNFRFTAASDMEAINLVFCAILEASDLASCAYYTYDAYIYLREARLVPSCREPGSLEELALVPLDPSECAMAVGLGWHQGGEGPPSCLTSLGLQTANCTVSEETLYKAEEQNCMRYKTRWCWNKKSILATTSSFSLMLSVWFSACTWTASVDGGQDVQEDNAQCLCVGVLLTNSCLVLPVWGVIIALHVHGLPDDEESIYNGLQDDPHSLDTGYRDPEHITGFGVCGLVLLSVAVYYSVLLSLKAIEGKDFVANKKAMYPAQCIQILIQALPKLIISAMDVWFFGWTVANCLGLCMSLAVPLLLQHVLWHGVRSLCQGLGICIPRWDIWASMRFWRGCLRSLWNAVVGCIWSSWRSLMGWCKGFLACWVDIKDPADSAADSQIESQSQS